MNNTRRLAAGLLTAAMIMGVLPAPVLAEQSSGDYNMNTSSFEQETPSPSTQLRTSLKQKGWVIDDQLEYIAWQKSTIAIYPTQVGWYEDESCEGCRFAPLSAPDGVVAFVTLVPRLEFDPFKKNIIPGEGRSIGVEVKESPDPNYYYVFEAGYYS